MPTTLLLQLVGPMQAWGFRSRFDNRDTGLEPTRSGVVGLLCAALGWGRDADLTPFDALRFGVRVERAGTVALDYHTAQPVWRDGPDAGTNVSSRFYLADARFLVALGSEDGAWLERLEASIKNPKWPLFLGRKSFAPALPLHFPGSGLREGGCEEVLREQVWHCFSLKEERAAERALPQLRLVLESDSPLEGVASPDVPRDFERRRYAVRYLRTGFCTPPAFAPHPLWRATS